MWSFHTIKLTKSILTWLIIVLPYVKHFILMWFDVVTMVTIFIITIRDVLSGVDTLKNIADIFIILTEEHWLSQQHLNNYHNQINRL